MHDPRLFDDAEIRLREQLQDLMEQHHVKVMKLSTEDAGMCFADIRSRHRLFGDLLPIQMKIGGPEARNDIRTGVRIGCGALIAPMIESRYALENFIRACRETLGDKHFLSTDLQINVETLQAAWKIDQILDCEAASQLKQITVGRHDLCRSINKNPNHPDVLEAVRTVVEAAHTRNISTSVGGRITPGDAERISQRIRPDRINTREIGFEVHDPETSHRAVKAILNYELKLLNHEQREYRQHLQRLTRRSQKLQKRKHR